MMDVDGTILGIAARQHGVVSRRQLANAGVPLHAIERRVTRGRLDRLHSGVYRVPPLAGAQEREWAAILSCGDGAVLSHFSAADTLGVAPRHVNDVFVSTSRGNPRSRPGLRVFRVRLAEGETTLCASLPITSAARTLLDLAPLVRPRALEQMMARAIHDELTTEQDIAGLLASHPRRPGARVLRALLATDVGPAWTRSRAEEIFLSLMRRARLPAPATNTGVAGHEVDFCWPAERLVVEIDGHRWHSSRIAFQRDRQRDAMLIAAGFRVMRLTWPDVTKHALATITRVAQALTR